MVNFSLMPTVSDPWEAMSEGRMASALEGFPPTAALEAGTAVLSYAERGESDRIIQWLNPKDRRRFDQWTASVRQTGAAITVVHPLAALLATRRALLHSHPGGTATHFEIERAIIQVAVRLNSVVAEPPVSKGSLAGSLTSALFWKSTDTVRWFHWSYELLSRLEVGSSTLATEFEAETKLTLCEWILRTQGEFATRYTKGATAYKTTVGIDPKLEAAWHKFSSLPASEFVEWCRISASNDPHDYGPLSFRPILVLEDGRRMPFSRDVLQRATTPNVIAQMIAEVTTSSLDQVAAVLGKLGEKAFLEHIERLSAHPDATLILEDDIPGRGKRCEAVLVGRALTSGFEVTHITPKRHLAGGAEFSTDAYVERLSKKFEQILESFEAVGPDGSTETVACLVQTTPCVWHPLIREAVEENLSNRHELYGITLAVANVFDVLDLIRLSASTQNLDQNLGSWLDDRQCYDLDYFVFDKDPESTGIKGDAMRFDQSVLDLLTRER